MKKMIFMILLPLLFMQGCSGQKKQEKFESFLPAGAGDTTQPKINIQVNKKYDAKGNLVQYDSTYSYVYSREGKMQRINADSLYNRFYSVLRPKIDDIISNNMKHIFFNDTLYKYDFYNSDYFGKRFELNETRFRDLFRQMDSVKAYMLLHEYPDGGFKPEPKM